MNTKKSLPAVLLFLFCCLTASAQQEVYTPDGKKVILNEDHTWEYAEEETETIKDEDLVKYSKPADAKSVSTSEKTGTRFYYNPTKWKQTKQNFNPMAELFFTYAKGDGHAMVIAERLGMPLETLKELAITNAQAVAENLRVVKEEYRMVNGKKMLCMQMAGKLKGIDFMYYGYYYSGENETVQYICFCGQNVFKEVEKSFEDMLNGMVVE